MDIEELRRLAAKEGLSLNYIAKDEMISKILLSLQEFDDIILKGGTAINRVYLKNKRFSEDLDFDLLFKEAGSTALSRANEIINRIGSFDIGRPRRMKDTIRYDISYLNPLNHKDKIRLEFNPIKRAGNYGKKIVNFGFVPYDSSMLNVYDIEELIRHKVDCIKDRMEGKDFFDLYYLLEYPHRPLKISKDDAKTILQRIDAAEKQIKSIVNVINHYIPKDRRPSWDIFLEEIKEKIKSIDI